MFFLSSELLEVVGLTLLLLLSNEMGTEDAFSFPFSILIYYFVELEQPVGSLLLQEVAYKSNCKVCGPQRWRSRPLERFPALIRGFESSPADGCSPRCGFDWRLIKKWENNDFSRWDKNAESGLWCVKGVIIALFVLATPRLCSRAYKQILLIALRRNWIIDFN